MAKQGERALRPIADRMRPEAGGVAPTRVDESGKFEQVVVFLIDASLFGFRLEHVGEIDKAKLIHDAIAQVVREGNVRTYDMLRIPGGRNVTAQGAASTRQMTDAILASLGKVAEPELEEILK